MEKLITTFKPCDFEGSGQYIIRGNKRVNWEVFLEGSGGRLSTFLYKVGFTIGKKTNYTLISMSDGWSYSVGDLNELCDKLNNDIDCDYRWATKEEILLLVESQIGNRIKG